MNRYKHVLLLGYFLISSAFFAQEKHDTVASNFRLEQVARGVYAVLRNDPPGLMCDGNSGFIISADYVIVIDAPESSIEVVKAIKKITDKPIKYVINTHWHDDHIIGNQVFKEAYPDVEFIAHSSVLTYLPEQGLKNRNAMLQSAPGGLAYIKTLLEKGESFGGGKITDEESESIKSDIKLVEQYLKVVPQTEIILPTKTFEDSLLIESKDRLVKLISLGGGHTAADIVVYLPEEKIIFSGDLVIHPIPLVGAEQSLIKEWSSSINNIIKLSPKVIIPGHGKVLHDTKYISQMSSLFDFIYNSVEGFVKKGKALEEIRKIIVLDEYKNQFAGDSKLKQILFDYYVKGPAVTAAFNKASAK